MVRVMTLLHWARKWGGSIETQSGSPDPTSMAGRKTKKRRRSWMLRLRCIRTRRYPNKRAKQLKCEGLQTEKNTMGAHIKQVIRTGANTTMHNICHSKKHGMAWAQLGSCGPKWVKAQTGPKEPKCAAHSVRRQVHILRTMAWAHGYCTQMRPNGPKWT